MTQSSNKLLLTDKSYLLGIIAAGYGALSSAQRAGLEGNSLLSCEALDELGDIIIKLHNLYAKLAKEVR